MKPTAGAPGDDLRFTALYEYDGPQILEARDAGHRLYVFLLLESSDTADRYLVAEVEAGRLSQFRDGALDLRTLLTTRSAEGWFLADAPDGLHGPQTLQPGTGKLSESGYLPEAGFLLEEAHKPA